MKGTHIRMAAAVFLSVIGVWWFVHDVQWNNVRAVLSTIHIGWVALAASTLLAEFMLRAYRWSTLLTPLGARPKLMDLWSATVIGAAVNTLIPLRAGEIAKPMVASRRTGIRLSTLFATNVMERVFDLLGMVTILVVMVLLLPGSRGNDELIQNLHWYGSWIGFGAISAMMVFFLLATREKAARGIFERNLKVGPPPLRPIILD